MILYNTRHWYFSERPYYEESEFAHDDVNPAPRKVVDLNYIILYNTRHWYFSERPYYEESEFAPNMMIIIDDQHFPVTNVNCELPIIQIHKELPCVHLLHTRMKHYQ